MKIQPEAQLLTLCCREDASPVMTDLQSIADSVKDWNEVVKLSEDHRVVPYVLPFFNQLSAVGHMPDQAMADMRAAARTSVAMHMHLRLALREILLAAKSESVPLIVMKGAPLAVLLYERPDVRPSGDIDLLCKEEDFEAAHKCLESLGYIAEDESKLPDRHSHEETYFERHFLHPTTRVHVELHVDGMKLGVRPKDSDSIWERLRTVKVDGVDVFTLSLEDQVFSLSVHLHRHGFNRLIWFKDIDLLVRKFGDDLDWREVMHQAEREGAKSSLWYTFRFLTMLMDTPIPQEIMASLRPNPLIRMAFRMIWPQSRIMNLTSATKRRAVQFSVLESWRGMMPSLILMGRRREKLSILIRRILPG